jgi:toxin-antitoxin system PIN domain toxin
VIAVDTNILVAFHRTEYFTHKKAVAKITALAEGYDSWAIPWPCVHEFLAVVTNPRIFEKPTSLAHAVEVIDVVLESPSLRLLGEGPDYWKDFRSLMLKGSVRGARVHDARIAALCLENGVRCLWTADRDFNRFPALTCINPCV